MTLLVETVARVASRMILVLGVGTLVRVGAEVHSNIAVIARELRIKDTTYFHLLVVEGGEGNSKTIEMVRNSKHLALHDDTRPRANYRKR